MTTVMKYEDLIVAIEGVETRLNGLELKLARMAERLDKSEQRSFRTRQAKPELPPLEEQKDALVADILSYFKETYRHHFKDGLNLRHLTTRYHTVAMKFGGIKTILADLVSQGILITQINKNGGQTFFYSQGAQEIDLSDALSKPRNNPHIGKRIQTKLPENTDPETKQKMEDFQRLLKG